MESKVKKCTSPTVKTMVMPGTRTEEASGHCRPSSVLSSPSPVAAMIEVKLRILYWPN